MLVQHRSGDRGLNWPKPAPPRKPSTRFSGLRQNVKEQRAHWRTLSGVHHADAESTHNNRSGSATRKRRTGEQGYQTANKTRQQDMCEAKGCVVNLKTMRTRRSGNRVHENRVFNNCDHGWTKIKQTKRKEHYLGARKSNISMRKKKKVAG